MIILKLAIFGNIFEVPLMRARKKLAVRFIYMLENEMAFLFFQERYKYWKNISKWNF